jgi:hypothetical protein
MEQIAQRTTLKKTVIAGQATALAQEAVDRLVDL